jgi:mannose-6-phosphate isomerase class I
MQIVACVSGSLSLESATVSIERSPGESCLVPACLENATLRARTAATLLRVEAG